MKKLLIVIILLVVVVLGGILILSNPQQQIQKATDKVGDLADEARGKAIDAGLKAFAVRAMADMVKYYSDPKNPNPSYTKKPANMRKLDQDLMTMKSKYPNDTFSYVIVDEQENAAVKVSDSSRSIYVCYDSLTAKATNIPADQFNQKTDCAGQMIK